MFIQYERFKDIVSIKADGWLEVKMDESNQVIRLNYLDGSEFQTQIFKGTPAETDFDTNYRSLCNSEKAKVGSIQHLGNGYVIRPVCWDISGTVGTTFSNDKPLSVVGADYYLLGGSFDMDVFNYGDWIQFQVVDVDGAVSPPGTVLENFIPEWKVMSGQNRIVDKDLSEPIPSIFYLRVVYNSTGSGVDPYGVVNIEGQVKK